ncbi:MAG: hypothetical protein H6868_01005 [Rhodospirillales bacterium]|nr:hypothetical protein [Rhodospirillales bacterium]
MDFSNFKASTARKAGRAGAVISTLMTATLAFAAVTAHQCGEDHANGVKTPVSACSALGAVASFIAGPR